MQLLFSQLQPHVYLVDIIDYADIILQPIFSVETVAYAS